MARSPLPAIAKAIAEEIVEFGNVVNLADRRFDIVLDPAVINGFAVEEDVARSPIGVAWLADGADVAQRLAGVELVLVVDLFGRMELIRVFADVFEEHARHVRMALETDAVDEAEDAVHLAVVVDVF